MRYRDTSGDDHLIGTAADDIFRIRLGGHDRVDGGDGRDRLVVDYSDVHPKYSGADISVLKNGTIQGKLTEAHATSLGFKHIEQFDFLATQEADGVRVQFYAEPGRGAISIDGGGGRDYLELDLMTFAPQHFFVDAGGVAHLGGGSFTGFASTTISFGDDDDVAVGGAMQELVDGNGGDDDLSGGGGDDLITGGEGVDRLTGGSGADIFRFDDTSETQVRAPDLVTDFSHGDGDIIDLFPIDTDPSVPGNQAFVFIDQDAFSGPGGRHAELRQEVNGDGTVTVQGDVNHDGVADFAILVTTSTPLVASDFEL